MSGSTQETNVVYGVYVNSTSTVMTASTMGFLTIDGLAYKDEQPENIGFWDTVNNKINLDGEEIGNYQTRIEFEFDKSSSVSFGDYILIEIKINGGSNSTNYKKEIGLFKNNQKIAEEVSFYSGDEVQEYGMIVEITPSVNGTISNQSIVVTSV